MKKTILFPALAVIFLMFLGISSPAHSAKEPIIIGFIHSMSGAMSMYGISSEAGGQIAVEEINAAGGILGRPLKMITRDDKLNAETGLREAKDLILSEKADFLTGTISSAVALAISNYVKREKKIFLVNISQSSSLTEENWHRYMLSQFVTDALETPTGVMIVTGPTGSGKTSTLYSCVNHLNNINTSIVTAEDPVEYVIEGIAQCSINPKIGVTFEETLRHIVRQDPDVIVLGEIRDNFSAETAIQAALTGHKVLTTFHTEDCIGGLMRLMNMQIEAFLISSTVVCVVAQRLLRRVCPDCAQSLPPHPAESGRLGYTGRAGGRRIQAGARLQKVPLQRLPGQDRRSSNCW